MELGFLRVSGVELFANYCVFKLVELVVSLSPPSLL